MLGGAYPRVCGATWQHTPVWDDVQGLSPRVRGNHHQIRKVSQWKWPIPACAGQPDCAGSLGATNRAYPRVCGATLVESSGLSCSWGLSPRVRGNLERGWLELEVFGPIPACAGQPFSTNIQLFKYRAYPRVCGATVKKKTTP